MRIRFISPSFVVALLALLIAASGMSFAAGRSGHHVGASNAKADKITLACPAHARKTFGLCMQLAASGPVKLAKARSVCDARGGRLPSLGELGYIAGLPGLTWANGQLNQYEFTSSNTTDTDTPVARDHAGNIFPDARGQSFWYHCLTMPTPK
jgi:hypothetical protein